ncbi:hypothetical protein ACFSCW_13565 [Sphingomonas tabacisoli]|uniref:Uncharacterized protein n=1 Tax=Sphingomonas tabacisoli TaxID=2249466 RepID=A0ABW4I7N9_9SPHN
MWDGISLQTLAVWAVVATTVASCLGLLPRGRTRVALVTLWVGLPVMIVCWACVVSSFDGEGFDWVGFFGPLAVFTLFLLPPWALLTLLPFNLVRRFRDIHAGIDYRSDR